MKLAHKICLGLGATGLLLAGGVYDGVKDTKKAGKEDLDNFADEVAKDSSLCTHFGEEITATRKAVIESVDGAASAEELILLLEQLETVLSDMDSYGSLSFLSPRTSAEKLQKMNDDLEKATKTMESLHAQGLCLNTDFLRSVGVKNDTDDGKVSRLNLVIETILFDEDADNLVLKLVRIPIEFSDTMYALKSEYDKLRTNMGNFVRAFGSLFFEHTVLTDKKYDRKLRRQPSNDEALNTVFSGKRVKRLTRQEITEMLEAGY